MTMTPFLYPLVAQVFLTFALMMIMAVKRVRAAQARRYKVRDIALDANNYPDDIVKYGNSFRNQFELPMLFYVLCVLLIMAGQGQNALYLNLAWGFVITRYIHAFIHVTSNHVIRRFYAFLIGALLLMVMWVMFAVEHFMLAN